MKKILVIGIINIVFLSLVAFFTYNYVISKKNRVEVLEKEIIKLQSEIDSVPASQESLNLSDFATQKFKVENVNYTLIKKKVSDLTTSKHPGSIGNSYLQTNDGKLFVASANGIFSFITLDHFFLDNSKLNIIPSNIRDIIKNPKFYARSAYGIKDLLIHENKFYISYTNEYKKDCYNTSILVSDITIKKLYFKKFFEPTECIKSSNEEYSPHQSGGRMVPYKENNILFTIGEYRFRDHAQNQDNIFGKILSINLSNRQTNIISMGHRNPQGLLFDNKKNIIYSTEHGPAGGDEININFSPDGKIKNFGWPISSYGEHYKEGGIAYHTGFDSNERENKKYKIWPLHKSHKDHGFLEPLKYFTPSIAISEIVSVNKNFNNISEQQIFVASMGNKIEEGDLSLHWFILDKDFGIKSHEIIKLNERIRDLFYDENSNKIFLFFESSASIGVLWGN
tara:strand:- start:488 stop:1843 length:1356 start_codon:yes stop_codon:yes gene_type:complete